MGSFAVSPAQLDPLLYSGSTLYFVPAVNEGRAPTTTDRNYPLFTFWRNADKNATFPNAEGDMWYLSRFVSNGSAQADAIWEKVGTPSTGTLFYLEDTAGNFASPDGMGAIQMLGAQVASGTIGANTIRSNSLSANSITYQIQQSGTAAAKDTTLNGICHFNSAQFSIDEGFVSLTGSGTSIDQVGVDAASGTGTDPVTPNGSGLITVTGGQVASGVIGANAIRTNSLNANEYTIQVQQSGSAAAQNTTLNGVCHFDSTDFTVTNGFVELAMGAGSTSIAVDANTAPGTDPVVPSLGVITMTGGQVASGAIGANVIQTNSLAANSLTIQVQRSGSAAAQDTTLNGVCHFDSAKFTVTNGFVTLLGSGSVDSIGVDASTAPGTDPVIPDGSGIITVTGGQVATGTVGANVIRTNSTAANTYAIEIQRSTTSAATDSTKNGVCHFNSTQFTVDANGFVGLSGGGGGSGISSLTTDVSGPVVPDGSGVVDVTGTNIYSDGSVGNTLTLNLQGTDHALFIGNGTNTPSGSLAVGTTGTALLGQTGADPTWGSVPNSVLTNSSVTINSGNNITVTGGSPLSLGGVASVAVTGTTNHAVQVGNASGSLTSLATGSSGQILQSAGAGANPGWTTATYPSTAAQGDIIYGSAANTLTTLAKDTNATRYLSNTGASNSPAWAQVNLSNGVTGTLTVANGGTSVASFTAYSPICGGTTSTGALQSVASLGSAGQVLTSNGAGALPTFQSVSGALQTATVTLTSAQVKALRATPQTIVPAQGAGTVILVLGFAAKLNYGGTNVFTNGQTCLLKYNNGSGATISATGCITAFLIQFNGDYYGISTFTAVNVADTGCENQPVVLHNTGGSEITGNAANNNTLTVYVTYQVLTL